MGMLILLQIYQSHSSYRILCVCPLMLCFFSRDISYFKTRCKLMQSGVFKQALKNADEKPTLCQEGYVHSVILNTNVLCIVFIMIVKIQLPAHTRRDL